MYVAETVNFNVWLCAGGGSGEAVDTSHPRPQTTGSRTAHTQNTSRHFVIRTDNGLSIQLAIDLLVRGRGRASTQPHC